MGRYYEEFRLGEQLTGASRTVTDLEIALLPTVMGALNPLFLDEETARQSAHGGRILYGPALLGIVLGLTEEMLRGTLVGLLGIDRLRFIRSVHAGDTITAHTEVTGLRPTSRPERGILQLRDWATNQRGETVLELERSILLLRQPPDPA
ncbi:MAG: MaoC family dehydratase [Dehalococcoidia bacterium]